MKMAKPMTVRISQELKDWCEEQYQSRGLSGISEFIKEILRNKKSQEELLLKDVDWLEIYSFLYDSIRMFHESNSLCAFSNIIFYTNKLIQYIDEYKNADPILRDNLIKEFDKLDFPFISQNKQKEIREIFEQLR